MKTFLVSPFYDPTLAVAAGKAKHVGQVDIVVVAARKTDIAQLCEDRGMNPGEAAGLQREARLNGMFGVLLAARKAGLIPADEAGVYAVGSVNGQQIARLEVDGTYTVVGRLVWQGGQFIAVPGPRT